MLALAAAVALLWVSSASAIAQKYVAFVIDNGARTSAPSSIVPVETEGSAGAVAVARRLSDMRYTVIRADQSGDKVFRDRLAEFGAASSRADVAVFYYYGRIMHAGGRNMLITDAAMQGGRPEYSTLPLDDVMAVMRAARGNIILVDGAYDDVVVDAISKSGTGAASSPGFIAMTPKENFLITFSAQPRKVMAAHEGRARFSRAVLAQLDRANDDWGRMGEDVRIRVLEESRQSQIPFFRNGLRDSVQIASLAPVPPPPPVLPAAPVEPPVLTQPQRSALWLRMRAELERSGCHPSQGPINLTVALAQLKQQNKGEASPQINFQTASAQDFDNWFAWSSRNQRTICTAVVAAPVVPPAVTPPRQQAARPTPAAQVPRRAAVRESGSGSGGGSSSRGSGGGGGNSSGGGRGTFSPGAF